MAAELFARQGDVSKINDVKDIMPIVALVPDSQVMSDLDATVAWAKGTGKADVAHLGITGFCWGGRIVCLYAAHNPKLRAGVAWYGPLIRNTTALQPQCWSREKRKTDHRVCESAIKIRHRRRGN